MPPKNFNENRKKFIGSVLPIFLLVAAFGVGILSGFLIARDSVSITLWEEGTPPFDTNFIGTVLNELNRLYLGEIPGSADLTYGVAEGIVNALDDKYTSFLTPEQAQDYLSFNDSAYEGIGVQLGYEEQYTVVVSPLDGYPGQIAGLLPGDFILEVDGEDVTGVRPEIVATMIRGEAGTTVSLFIYRTDTQEAFQVDVLRQKIDLENITYKELEEGIYHIDILKFTEGAQGNKSGVQVFNSEWDKVVDEIAAESPKGLIVDLRNNPGGYVDSVRYVAEEFLKTGQIIMREQEKGEATERLYHDDRVGVFEDIPVIVLVNSGSASASEIFAAAIRDNYVGKVVGESTVGKGVEQQLVSLNDGSLMLIVFRRWLTAGGQQLTSDNPIVPDVMVEAGSESEDPFLDEGLKALRDLLE